MLKQKIVIIGGGGHAIVVASIIEDMGLFSIAGYVAPEPSKNDFFRRFRYLGNDNIIPSIVEQRIKLAAMGVGGIGDNRLRKDLFVKIKSTGLEFPIIQHPKAIIASEVEMGSGTIIAAGAIVSPGVKLGVNVIVNTGAIIEHDCFIGDHVHIAPGSVVCGGAKIGDLAHIGAGAIVLQGVVIGERAVVGAGAVVTKDVKAGSVVVGNPARVIREVGMKD